MVIPSLPDLLKQRIPTLHIPLQDLRVAPTRAHVLISTLATMMHAGSATLRAAKRINMRHLWLSTLFAKQLYRLPQMLTAEKRHGALSKRHMGSSVAPVARLSKRHMLLRTEGGSATPPVHRGRQCHATCSQTCSMVIFYGTMENIFDGNILWHVCFSGDLSAQATLAST